MESFLVSTAIVAVAEIGDKTQLLALVLAARFRRPWPIIAGIFVATIANHAGAAFLGATVADLIDSAILHWILVAGFVAMGLWMLVPDHVDEEATPKAPRLGVFGATAVAFFLLEMGDKTQVATVALAARYADWMLVTKGPTLGMMLTNVPAVLIGQAATRIVPLRAVHLLAAIAFFVLAILLAANRILGLSG